MQVDHEGFEREMDKQRERARQARQDVGSMQVQGGALRDIMTESEFIGYSDIKTETKIAELLQDGELVDLVQEGQKVQFILEKRRSMLKAADKSVIKAGLKAVMRLFASQTLKAPNGQHLHEGIVESGAIKKA